MEEAMDTLSSLRGGYAKRKRSRLLIVLGLLLLLFPVVILACLLGPSSLTVGESFLAFFGVGEASAVRIVWQIRMPRVLAGILAGASLSLAGLILQTTLGNIMASPSTLGVTNAAVFGANLSILVLYGGYYSTGNNAQNVVAGINPYLASTFAFIFAILSVLFILGLSAFRRYSPNVVVLAGLALGAVWTGLTTLLQYFSTDVGLSSAIIWSFGDLGRASYTDTILMGSALLVCSVIFFVLRHRYNALLSGEGYAKSLGVNVSLLRVISLLTSSLLVAVSVSKVGLIGFIGIICPHAMRKILGNDHSYLVPASLLSGSLLLVLADTLGRTIAGGASLPVGAVTAVLGAPFFLFLIFSKKEGSHA